MDLDRRIADAVKMARSPNRLRGASGALLAEAAILVARAVVIAAEQRGRNRQLRADAMSMLDEAGLSIAAEMRRRKAETAA